MAAGIRQCIYIAPDVCAAAAGFILLPGDFFFPDYANH